MAYKIYTTSTKAWDAMLSEIDQAKKSIFLEMYIFQEDTTSSHDFIGKLTKKAKQGIKVILVLDAFGSSDLSEKSIKSMQSAGIEVVFFSDWLRRIHRKILIVDENVAFVGGVNIGKKFAAWNDLQLKLKGKVIRPVVTSFAYTYEMAGGKNKHILMLRKKTLTSKLKFWFLEHWPVLGMYSLKSIYTRKILSAQKSIRIVTPYFTPPRWFAALLDGAVRRGVKVEIIIPRKTDLPLVDRANQHHIYNLSQLGVKFFLGREMNHAKIMLIDDQEGLVGSQNIDFLSFSFNAESGVFFKQKNIVAELRKIILRWEKEASIYNPRRYKMSLVDYLIFPIIKLIYHLL
ncbi:MAG: phosphatidylserine/phosphatidylglycerophosphate/cardiolipin synthase family protein [Candidatus Moranbacteria bacterium]|nr:phosphatidylserine/phosphatidylglycerophosphate/cardiolipin synthase family protein [Candidatus Moranbacteria bacterium]